MSEYTAADQRADRAFLVGVDYGIAKTRADLVAEIRAFGNRMATPAHPDLDGPTLYHVWREAQAFADLLDKRGQR